MYTLSCVPTLPSVVRDIPTPWTFRACYILYILMVIYPESYYAVQVVYRCDSQRTFE